MEMDDMSKIEDNRAMFLFRDEADALEAKDFFIEQDRTMWTAGAVWGVGLSP